MILLRYCFNLTCFSIAFGMTIFWIYKFLKDDDLCQVDFKSIETLTEGNYPMLSVCLWNGFIEHKIRQYNNSLSVQKYKNFLEGKAYYNGIEKIDFDDVTLNIEDLYIGDSIKFRNGTLINSRRPNFLNDVPRVSYTSIQDGILVKCFGLQFQYTNVASGDCDVHGYAGCFCLNPLTFGST